MAESAKPNTSWLFFLVLVAAAVGFWLHGTASGQPATPAPSTVPSASVVPIVISQPAATSGGQSPEIHLNLTTEPSGVTVNSYGQPSSGAPSNPAQAVAVAVAPESGPASGSTPTQLVVQDYSVSVNGSNVVVAKDGSIVQVGDNGDLDANTGDSSAGGSIGVEVSDSTIAPGSSAAAATASGPHAVEHSAAPAPTSATSPSTTVSSPPPATSSPVTLPQITVPTGGATSISGFEDHSINIGGDDNLVTYDDSNVFISRDGHINANTGDTDSSGLNVVDASDSTVRSGNSGDGEGSDDDEDEDAIEAGGTADSDNASMDDDFDSDLEDDTDSTPGTTASPAGASASVDDEDVSTTATGANAFVIGGDGFDDLAVRISGSGNIVTYDDGNVVVGGTGDVNAQVGDSDTAGAVVMGVHHSVIEAGCEGDLCPLYED